MSPTQQSIFVCKFFCEKSTGLWDFIGNITSEKSYTAQVYKQSESSHPFKCIVSAKVKMTGSNFRVYKNIRGV